jgi:hypothetical protein
LRRRSPQLARTRRQKTFQLLVAFSGRDVRDTLAHVVSPEAPHADEVTRAEPTRGDTQSVPKLTKLALVLVAARRQRAELAMRHRQLSHLGNVCGGPSSSLEALDRRLEVHADDERSARTRLIPTPDGTRPGYGPRIGVRRFISRPWLFRTGRSRRATEDASVAPAAHSDEKIAAVVSGLFGEHTLEARPATVEARERLTVRRLESSERATARNDPSDRHMPGGQRLGLLNALRGDANRGRPTTREEQSNTYRASAHEKTLGSGAHSAEDSSAITSRRRRR